MGWVLSKRASQKTQTPWPVSAIGQFPGRAAAERISSKKWCDRQPEQYSMDETIAKLNIEHYEKLLASETDSTRRATIARLLAEEEAKLAKISKGQKEI